ncbi:alpha/beta fold hydrolase [Actinoplanes sp. NEAU-A12]|uniref:Alpha/beta fold hydrolase n=1 Tax=Actinoplanes sandaracinus TaxID=3045177 RepID=A0ABT6WRG1_9ACTN|nr:alpha/beta fold hydrolase [Actinoplanes sandaracinus]MDI6102283.1 alpha/beta fold hydrolase [Actinoplanes sandaracinus]
MVSLTLGTAQFVALHRSRHDDVRLSVVLIPGWREPRSGHLRLYARLADALWDSGVPVETWQFDLAGQGESVLPDDAGRWPEQLAAVVAQCRARVYLIGRGMGAVLAAAVGDAAARVVAVAPPHLGAAQADRIEQLGCEEAVLADKEAGRRRAAQLWQQVGPASYDLTVPADDALDLIRRDVVDFQRGEGPC